MDQSTEPTPSAASAAALTHPSAALLSAGERLFAGGGDMGKILADIDWAKTPLGPVETWPQTLRTSLRICLTSRHDIILWWGPELRVFYNDAYAPTLGIHHPAAAGKPGREVWAEIWDVIGPMLEGVLTTGQPTWSYDQLLYLERNGFPEETYHTYSYSPIEDDTGAVGGVFTAVTETTLRVLAERRAVLARDLAAAVVDARTAEEVCLRAMRALATGSSDVPFAQLYLLDREGRHARLASSIGLTPGASFAPAEMELTVDPAESHGSAYGWPLAQVMETGRPVVVTDLPRWPGVTTALSARGLPLRAVALPVSEPGLPSPSAILVVGVNPHRALDDEYERFYELLASHLASALASAHAYEQERRRAEALAEIDRAKTTFFTNVSHEFRTPLTLMLGPLEELLARPAALPPDEYTQLDLIHRNGLRLLKLVNTLLDFARIEAGRVRADYTPTDLGSATTDLASAFRSLVEQAGMRLIVDCPSLDGSLREPVYVDREMWEKIVLNLLSNAFKFTFVGSIAVTLRAAEDRRQVVLTVSDTGVGIPPEELPHLFERFHRTQGTRSRSFEGSGIGLALAQELIHLHGGSISVTSQVGEGSTFTVTLPTGTAHLPPERIQQGQSQHTAVSTATGAISFIEEARRWLPVDQQEAHDDGTGETALLREDLSGASPEPPPPGSARILLADDNADLRDYLGRLLSQRYQVEAVADGMAALEAARARPPDLVLSDVMMPELDGFGLLAALRGDPATQAVPVILLSARAGEEATIEGLAAGADDYLVKPFSAREALSRVAARLEIARLRREAEARAHELETAFAAMADGVAVYDREGHIITANDTWRAMAARVIGAEHLTGTLAERAARTQFLTVDGRVLPPESWPQTRIMAGETLAGSSAADIAFDTPTGRVFYGLTGAPLRDVDGTISGIVLITRDLTERRRLDREAAERASLLEAVFSAAPDQISIFDAAGSVVQLNTAASESAGLVDSERQPMRLDEVSRRYDLRTPDGAPFPAEDLPVARALHGEMVTGVEMRLRDAGGRDRTILESAAPYFDAARRVRGAVSVVHDITTLRQMEREAHWQATMLERAHDAIFVWELGGPIVYWNRGAELLYGFTPDMALGRISHELLQTRLPALRLDFEAALEREGEWTGELTHTTRDGREIFVLSRLQLLRREPDGHRYVLETGRDITDRLMLERKVRASEAQLRTILKLLPVGVTFVDAHGNIALANQAANEIWGEDVLAAQNRVDFGASAAWWPATGKRIASEEWGLARALKTGEVSIGEEVDIATYDGAHRTILNSSAPLRDESGTIMGGMSVAMDITERKRLERRTRVALDGLLAMAEALVSDTGIDRAGGIDGASSTHEASTDESALTRTLPVARRLAELTRGLLGCSRVSITACEGKDLRTRPVAIAGLAPEQEAQWWEEQRPLAGRPAGESMTPEDWQRLQAGETTIFDLTRPPYEYLNSYGVTVILAAPMLIQGQMVGLLGLDFRNSGKEPHVFTAEELQLAKAIARLGAVMLERDRLQRDRSAAEARELALAEANRRMDEFMSIASHELRTPLTSMIANVQMARRQLAALAGHGRSELGENGAQGDPKLERAALLLERTDRQVQRLNRLVGDLLDASRIQARKLEMRPEPCDLLEIVRDAVREQRIVWPRRTITLDAPRHLPVNVTADGDRIGQVVTNYLVNALKYSRDEQPVTMRIRADDRHAQVEVRDHGPGLTRHQQEHLFELFYRVPGIEQLSGSGVGLGLGLHICKTIVERHGGAVGVRSVRGDGSTFWFTLPLSGDTMPA